MSDLPTILPPNATAIMRALEQALRGEICALPHVLRTLHDPYEVPEPALAPLAWALSVDLWRDEWPDDLKRAVVAASLDVHRRKGSVGAVRRSLAALGVDIEIQEWFETGADAHTFLLTAIPVHDYLERTEGAMLHGALISDIWNAARSSKPLRSHMTLRLRSLSKIVAGVRVAGSGLDRLSAVAALRHPTYNAKTSFGATAAGAAFDHLRVIAPLRHPTYRANAAANVRVAGAGFDRLFASTPLRHPPYRALAATGVRVAGAARQILRVNLEPRNAA